MQWCKPMQSVIHNFGINSGKKQWRKIESWYRLGGSGLTTACSSRWRESRFGIWQTWPQLPSLPQLLCPFWPFPRTTLDLKVTQTPDPHPDLNQYLNFRCHHTHPWQLARLGPDPWPLGGHHLQHRGHLDPLGSGLGILSRSRLCPMLSMWKTGSSTGSEASSVISMMTQVLRSFWLSGEHRSDCAKENEAFLDKLPSRSRDNLTIKVNHHLLFSSIGQCSMSGVLSIPEALASRFGSSRLYLFKQQVIDSASQVHPWYDSHLSFQALSGVPKWRTNQEALSQRRGKSIQLLQLWLWPLWQLCHCCPWRIAWHTCRRMGLCLNTSSRFNYLYN